MKEFSDFRFLLVLGLLVTKVTGNDREQYQRLYNELIASIGANHLFPRYDKPNQVDIIMAIGAILNFEEVSSTLTITAAFTIFWVDETRKWSLADYSMKKTEMPVLQTWTPRLTIQNGIDRLSLYAFDDDFDIKTATVSAHYHGYTELKFGGKYHVICDSDVTFYPADEHICTLRIVAEDQQVELTSDYDIDMNFLVPNGEWHITESMTKNSSFCKQLVGGLPMSDTECQSALEFTVILKRSYMYAMLNLIIPIIIVSFVHIFVFLLPIESGERTSFAFTLLLTLIVFMSMVSEQLPASNNISVINIFLIHQLLSSVLTTFLTVIGIQIFHKDTEIEKAGWLYKVTTWFYKLSLRKGRNKKANKVTDSWARRADNFDSISTAAKRDLELSRINSILKKVHTKRNSDGGDKGKQEEITSKQISIFFDNFCFWFQCAIYFASYVGYGLYILVSSKQ